jgi:aryl-alcohol dehydrogenase-like predicted oxidoreductase
MTVSSGPAAPFRPHHRAPRIGFGAMHLSDPGRGPAAGQRLDRTGARSVVHTALDVGIRLLDTADAYCLDRADTGHNERVVADAVRTWPGTDDERAEVVIATKGGHIRGDDGSWDVDGRPESLIAAAEASRDRLGVDRIALYQFHRPDPDVPWLRSIEALAELRVRSVVEHVGLSNVSVDQLEEAATIIDIASVQNELSPFNLGATDVVAWCHARDIPFLAWAPLGGAGRAKALLADQRLSAFGDIAHEYAVSVARVVLAWLTSLSPVVVPIPGTTRESAVIDAAAATTLRLDRDQLDALDRSVGHATS